MSDRSDEVTRNRDTSTDELLEETERLLGDDASEPSSVDDAGPDREPGPGLEPEPDRNLDPNTESRWGATADSSEPTASTAERDSRLRSLGAWLSPTAYFSPKAFLALVLVLGAGLLAGGVTIPIGGRTVGMAVVAFLVGLVGSRRRYLEVGAAGVAVGGVSALLNHAVLAVAGSGEAVTAVGAGVGLLVCTLAYYFGRDLRDGLVRDVG